MSKIDLRLQCGMPCSKLEVSTVQHGTLSGTGYLHQSRLDDHVGIEMSDGVGHLRLGYNVAGAHVSPTSFSNCAILARRATISERLSVSSSFARLSSVRPGRGLSRAGEGEFRRAMRRGAM